MSILNQALLVGASQGALLCIVILSLPSANRTANRLLASYVGLESLHLFFLYTSYMDDAATPGAWLRLLFGLRALDGPAVYLYVRALSEADFRWHSGLLRHLWVLLFLFGWFAVLISDPAWRALSTRELQQLPSTVAMSAYQSLVLAGYGLVAWRRLAAHQRRLRQTLSAVDRVNLDWLSWLMGALIATNALHLALDLLRLLGLVGADAKVLVNLCMTLLLIYLISIGGLRQSKVFTDPVREALASVDEPAPAEETGQNGGTDRSKYQKSGLDEARRTEIWNCLQALLEQERPHLDPGLSLPGLARLLRVRPQELSEVINTVYGGSFYDLVNRARVDMAKVLLREPRARCRKMLDIALSVGFSSQSTFYSQFRKQTGMTPTVWRDKGEGWPEGGETADA